MGVRLVYPGIYEFDPKVEGDDSETMAIKISLSKMPLETRYTKRLSTFEKVKGREEALEAAMSFVRGEIKPPLLLFYGEPGRSKTHLSLAIGWCFLAQLKSVRFYHVSEMLDALRAGYKMRDKGQEFAVDSYESIMNYVQKCRLLILDDIGVQKDTDWAAERLDTIVNCRYEHELPTVITTNTLDISDRILDRMKEGKVVLCEGESYREIIQRRKGSKSMKGVKV